MDLTFFLNADKILIELMFKTFQSPFSLEQTSGKKKMNISKKLSVAEITVMYS